MGDAQEDDDATTTTTPFVEYKWHQHVKSFDDEDFAGSDEFDSVLATKQFVVFQLCL